jgi:hypothetical protein
MHNPSDDYYLATDWVIWYLDGTSIYALEFGSIPKAIIYMFEGSSDILFANLKERKSSEGRYF